MSVLDRASFASRFGRRALFGMVHLLPLPGAPLYRGSLDEVIEAAVLDAQAIASGGASGVVVENFGDRPFFASAVPPETAAAMTRVVTEVRRASALPLGVNVLRNDARSALAVAVATGASFIRVNVHTGAMLTDQGVIEGHAAETLRMRRALAPEIAIFADHLVKHAVPLAPADPLQTARDLRLRGLADALIVTGAETGAAVDAGWLETLRGALGETPLLVGSGLDTTNASRFPEADGAIVGTSLKQGERVRAERVAELVRAFGGRFT